MVDRSERERDLERRADELLAESVRRDGRGEYPFYTERWLRELRRRERSGVEYMPARGGGRLEARLGGMVVDAQLTRRQRQVIRWVVRGISQREIARMLGISESQVCRVKQAAIRRMRDTGVLP